MTKEKNIICKVCNRKTEPISDDKLYSEKSGYGRMKCVNIGCRVFQSIEFLVKDVARAKEIHKKMYQTTLDVLKEKKNTSSGIKQYKLIKELLLQKPTRVERKGSTINMEFTNMKTYTFKNNEGEERFTITR